MLVKRKQKVHTDFVLVTAISHLLAAREQSPRAGLDYASTLSQNVPPSAGGGEKKEVRGAIIVCGMKRNKKKAALPLKTLSPCCV